MRPLGKNRYLIHFKTTVLMMKQLAMDGQLTMSLKNEAANIHLESTQYPLL